MFISHPERINLWDDAFHIFICFSSKDEAVARDVVQFLEAEGLKCWISLRDVPPGQNYQEAIVYALETAGSIVFLFSEFSRQSREVKKELSIAGGINVPVFPLRLSPITPLGALRYELATRQWIDIFPDREYAFHRLAKSLREVLRAAATAGHERLCASLLPATTAGMVELAPDLAATSPAKKPAQPAHTPIVAPGSEAFEAMRVLLARHIGPIARVFVQNAANETRTPDDFCERLAAHVSAPSDRAAFLRQARARFAMKS